MSWLQRPVQKRRRGGEEERRKGGEEERRRGEEITSMSVPFPRQDLNNLITSLNNLLTYLHREVHGECPLPDKIANGGVVLRGGVEKGDEKWLILGVLLNQGW